MKILIISGASENGHTAGLCSAFMSSLPGDTECSLVNALSADIAHCDGCGACSSGRCRYDDGMTRIIEMFGGADAVIFATPIRFNGPSSAVKTVMDRFQAVWNNPDLVEHRPRVMSYMATSGSGNPDPKPCNTIFRSFCLSFGGVWEEPYIFRGTDLSDEGMEEGAKRFADQIVSKTAGSI